MMPLSEMVHLAPRGLTSPLTLRTRQTQGPISIGAHIANLSKFATGSPPRLQDEMTLRLHLYYVSYIRVTFSIWHSPTITPISSGSPSILGRSMIASRSPRMALHSPSIKRHSPPQ
ncbi:hypothetical protein Acr_00g0008730 [Actinidia rufa]|uniref:Uncharacterized protein n=1 Tax=Actinidia rufa TaxID=165716 RepID=A0A7J0DAJ5_9ERIC|nr:hypothetical protein Acr_00g0008730 [Actinidia rufa]